MAHLEIADLGIYGANFIICFWETLRKVPQTYNTVGYFSTDATGEPGFPEKTNCYSMLKEGITALDQIMPLVDPSVELMTTIVNTYRLNHPNSKVLSTIPKFNFCNFVVEVIGGKPVIKGCDYKITFFLYTE